MNTLESFSPQKKSNETEKTSTPETLPIDPEVLKQLKNEAQESEQKNQNKVSIGTENQGIPQNKLNAEMEQTAQLEISQEMKEQIATIVEQLEEEAVLIENVGEEALAKAPSPEKKSRIGKLGKALTLILLTVSIHGATAMYSSAEAGGHRHRSNPTENILKGAAMGAVLGAAIGLSETLQKCLPQNERPIYVQRRPRYAKSEDAVRYERQRDQIFNQYLRMKVRDPVGAEYFLRDSMNALNSTYERY